MAKCCRYARFLYPQAPLVLQKRCYENTDYIRFDQQSASGAAKSPLIQHKDIESVESSRKNNKDYRISLFSSSRFDIISQTHCTLLKKFQAKDILNLGK